MKNVPLALGIECTRTNLIYPEIDDTAWKKEELLKEMYYVYMTKYQGGYKKNGEDT